MSGSPQSPSKDGDQPVHSADEDNQMNDSTDPNSAGIAGFDYEGVKEQDRWLPIANGTYYKNSPFSRLCAANITLALIRL